MLSWKKNTDKDHIICLIVMQLIEFPFNLVLKLLFLLVREIASLKQNPLITEIVASRYHLARNVMAELEQSKAVDTDLEKGWEMGTWRLAKEKDLHII